MRSVSWIVWGAGLCLVCIILALFVKVYLLRKAAGEIREGISRVLASETNVLLTISSHDGEMKRLAAALNVELRNLCEQRHRYEQGDLKLKEAVANISHDIRTPLTALCGYLELTKQQLAQMPAQEDTETLRRYLGIMENRAEVLARLTEELFRYTVVTSRVSDVIFEETILNHLLEESISVYYGALNENEITPVIKMPENMVKSRLNKDILS
ncbi:MAG: sensor histidine kinase, partial [Lachnospiraceae bacterium]|nr:sensor histidine kinase [Lachnospiraceae bacterium]